MPWTVTSMLCVIFLLSVTFKRIIFSLLCEHLSPTADSPRFGRQSYTGSTNYSIYILCSRYLRMAKFHIFCVIELLILAYFLYLESKRLHFLYIRMQDSLIFFVLEGKILCLIYTRMHSIFHERFKTWGTAEREESYLLVLNILMMCKKCRID